MESTLSKAFRISMNRRVTLSLLCVICFTFLTGVDGRKKDSYGRFVPYIDDSGSYVDIVVAFGKDVEQNYKDDADTIVSNLKKIFTEFSGSLFTATKSFLRVKTVTVSLPFSWTLNNNSHLRLERSTGEDISTANVIVDTSTSRHGDQQSYVKRIGGCGQSGIYIHFTPDFFNGTFSEEEFSEKGRLLLKDWAHFRYGVFPEHENRKYNGRDGNKHPVSCPLDVSESEHPPHSASVMAHPRNKNVSQFCDSDESNSKTLHNKEAPTLQNRRCRGQSVWDVLRAHDDFRGLAEHNSISVSEEKVTNSVEINIVRQREEPYGLYLIVDTQVLIGNVQVVNDIKAMIGELPIPSTLSITFLQFSSGESVFYGFVLRSRISNETDRKFAEETISTEPGQSGSSDIDFLPQKLKIGNDVVDLVMVTAEKERWKRLRLGIGGKFDCFLRSSNLRNQKTGSCTKYHKHVLRNLAREANRRAIATGASEQTHYTIAEVESNPGNSSTVAGQVTLDRQSANHGAVWSFQLFYDIGTELIETYQFENLTIFTVVNETFNETYKANLSWEMPPNSQPGIWQYEMTVPEEVTLVKLVVKGPGKDVFEITPLQAAQSVDFEDGSLPIQTLAAEVTRGGLPMGNVVVIADVTVDDEIAHVTLRDNGAGADTEVGDGIYSAYFTGYQSNGTYAVQIRVESGDQKSNPGKRTRREAPSSDDPFQRTVGGGVFDVLNLPHSLEYPPANISDLDISGQNNRTLNLTFTAPGDDLDSGTADKYVACVGADVDETLACNKSVDITPKPALSGEKEHLTVNVSDSETGLDDGGGYLAIKALDPKGSSGISNPVLLAFLDNSLSGTEQPGVPKTTTPDTPASKPNDGKASGDDLIIIVGAVLGVCVFITIVLVVCLCCWYRRRKQNRGRRTLTPENPNCKSIAPARQAVVSGIDSPGSFQTDDSLHLSLPPDIQPPRSPLVLNPVFSQDLPSHDHRQQSGFYDGHIGPVDDAAGAASAGGGAAAAAAAAGAAQGPSQGRAESGQYQPNISHYSNLPFNRGEQSSGDYRKNISDRRGDMQPQTHTGSGQYRKNISNRSVEHYSAGSGMYHTRVSQPTELPNVQESEEGDSGGSVVRTPQQQSLQYRKHVSGAQPEPHAYRTGPGHAGSGVYKQTVGPEDNSAPQTAAAVLRKPDRNSRLPRVDATVIKQWLSKLRPVNRKSGTPKQVDSDEDDNDDVYQEVDESMKGPPPPVPRKPTSSKVRRAAERRQMRQAPPSEEPEEDYDDVAGIASVSTSRTGSQSTSGYLEPVGFQPPSAMHRVPTPDQDLYQVVDDDPSNPYNRNNAVLNGTGVPDSIYQNTAFNGQRGGDEMYYADTVPGQNLHWQQGPPQAHPQADPIYQNYGNRGQGHIQPLTREVPRTREYISSVYEQIEQENGNQADFGSREGFDPNMLNRPNVNLGVNAVGALHNVPSGPTTQGPPTSPKRNLFGVVKAKFLGRQDPPNPSSMT